MPAHLRTIGYKLRPSSAVKVRLTEKQADGFYLSPEWRTLIASIINQRGRRCEDPDHEAIEPRIGVRIYGDHIKELKDGGSPLDPNNIMLRCPRCHQRKTADERRRRLQR